MSSHRGATHCSVGHAGCCRCLRSPRRINMHKNGSASFERRLDALKESVRHLVDAGGERAGKLKDKAIDVKDSVVETSGAALSRLGSLIKDHPIAAIGVAFGVGYLTVRMLRK